VTPRLALLAATLLALIAGRATAVEVVVRPADGEEVRGALSALNGKALLLAPAAGGTVKFELPDMMAVEFPAVAEPSGEGCAWLYTASGDAIPAKLEADAGGKLLATSPWAGKFEVNSKALLGILLPAGLKDDKIRAEVARPGRRKDKVFLINDEMEGSCEGLAGGVVKFKSEALGAMEYKMEEVAGLAFADLHTVKAPAGTYCVAELAGGGRVSGQPVELDGEGLRWRTADGTELRLLLSAVSAIRVRSGRVTYLSDLAPAAVEEKHFVGSLPFVWKFRNDLDVFGRPLVLGGVKFRRGLGAAAHTQLSYNLEGAGFKRFKAFAGISDATAAGGHTLFRVLVDGKEAFATKPLLTRGDKPVAVDVSVEKAKELTLIVDFGDDSDLGDIGGWGDARLVK
jgi:hypothetical protein